MEAGQRDESVDSAAARRTLEAMRLGVVPAAGVESLTVGREGESDGVRDDLRRTDDAGGALRVFLGDYGTGKSHMLEVVRRLALDRDFLVGRVVLDPNEAAPSHPKRVYNRLVRSLTYPDRPSVERPGLRPLLDRAVEQPEVLEQFLADSSATPVRDLLDEGAHLYLTPALRYWGAFRDASRSDDADNEPEEADRAAQLVVDWLEGETEVATESIDRAARGAFGGLGKLYCMMDYRPWARIYGYLASGVASLARSGGYAGLVVLFDEAEFYSLLSAENKRYARTLFKAFARASVPDARADQLPFDDEALDLGGYGVQQELPARYDVDSHLYAVFAMTPHQEGVEAVESAVPDRVLTELSPFGESEYRALVESTVHHYRRGTDLDDRIADRVAGPLTKLVDGLLTGGYLDNPRTAMKFLVEFLDIARHTPDRVPDVLAELRERVGLRADDT